VGSEWFYGKHVHTVEFWELIELSGGKRYPEVPREFKGHPGLRGHLLE